MFISLISGSQRLNSQTFKVAAYLNSRLGKLNSGVETFLLDLASADLPFAESEASKTDEFKSKWTQISEKLNKSDGFVFLSPEWNGSMTPAILNFFLLAKLTLAHKPVLLTTVSGSRGGAFPISDLRITGYKNTRALYLPEHIIVRNVKEVLNDLNPKVGDHEELYLKRRIDFALKLLSEYATAVKPIRSSKIIDYESFPNGMQ